MKLFETKLPYAFSRALFTEVNYDFPEQHLEKLYDIIFSGTANLLAHSKSMDKPTAFIFENVASNFIAACVVQYFENEDNENPGNWNMIWTYNENDIPENTHRISIKDTMTHPYFRGVAGEKYGILFKDSECISVTITYALSQLKKWLDENAKEGEEVMIECDGIFQARVAVEGGEKVFSIEPDGEIKNVIKDDAAIEKVA